jgi:hypothetical protein
VIYLVTVKPVTPSLLGGAAGVAFTLAVYSSVAMTASVLSRENTPWWKVCGLFAGGLVNLAACCMIIVWLTTQS